MREEKVTIRVAMRPVAWKRSGGRGKVRFTPTENRIFRLSLQSAVMYELSDGLDGRSAPIPIFPTGDLHVEIQAGPTKADGDNVEKEIWDSMNGILWADDRQILSHATWLFRKGEPMIEISVRRA